MTWHRYRNLFAGLCAMALAGSYIGYDIVRASLNQWPGWWDAIAGSHDPPQHGDILNYTSFTTLPAGEFQVVTGTRFDDSVRRNIVHQWCYLERRNTIFGDLDHKVDLIDIEGAIAVTAQYTPRALREFGLSATALDAWAESHCKFK